MHTRRTALWTWFQANLSSQKAMGVSICLLKQSLLLVILHQLIMIVLQKLTKIIHAPKITKCIRSNAPAKPILFFDFHCEMIISRCVLSHSRLALPLLLLLCVPPLISAKDGCFPSSISGSLPLVLPFKFPVRVVSYVYASSSTSTIKYGDDTTSLEMVWEVIMILYWYGPTMRGKWGRPSDWSTFMNESSSNVCDDVVFWIEWFWEEELVGWHMIIVAKNNKWLVYLPIWYLYLFKITIELVTMWLDLPWLADEWLTRIYLVRIQLWHLWPSCNVCMFRVVFFWPETQGYPEETALSHSSVVQSFSQSKINFLVKWEG